jgi:hypothetical protein
MEKKLTDKHGWGLKTQAEKIWNTKTAKEMGHEMTSRKE